jgi:hypothetical protein
MRTGVLSAEMVCNEEFLNSKGTTSLAPASGSMGAAGRGGPPGARGRGMPPGMARGRGGPPIPGMMGRGRAP